ncbi:AAA family ATPase, partial [bacterium]|nr:AAA family ATPase [bacterium]
ELVGLAKKDFRYISPFALSGGEKRRVALAGVLSMRPECLVLDEPTAGLDPKSSREILEVLLKLNEQEKITMIMISHNFEDMALWCQRAIVMHKGKIVFDGSFREAMYSKDILTGAGLKSPDICKLSLYLQTKGIFTDKDRPVTVEEFVELLV